MTSPHSASEDRETDTEAETKSKSKPKRKRKRKIKCRLQSVYKTQSVLTLHKIIESSSGNADKCADGRRPNRI